MSGGRDPAVLLDDGRFRPEAPPTPFVALQRIVVRMLFDPAFVAEVYADVDAALEAHDIPESLRRQLVTNDRRLWNADRERRRRALAVLVEEFPGATTLFLLARRRLRDLDAFFASSLFHAAVMERRYMALAFARFLAAEEAENAPLLAVLELEAAMATARRRMRETARGRDPRAVAPERGAPLRYVNATPFSALFLPEGTLEIVRHLERWRFEAGLVPAFGLCTDAPSPEPLPELGSGETGYLLDARGPTEVGIEDVAEGFGRVLVGLERSATLEELAARLGDAAPEPRRLRERVETLVDAGIVRASTAGERLPT